MKKEIAMTRFIWLPCLLASSLLIGAPEKATPKSVTGWVLELACAKNGSPLVILQDDGMVYWPISESMPAVGQNERLLPFAGKRVTASGKLFTRGGSHALVIEKIDEARSGK
jgi:hypothetical protein